MTRKRQPGFALIMVLVLLAAATLLGASYMNSASLKLHSSLNMAAVSRAKSMGESGIDHAWCLLVEAPDLLTGTEGNPHGPYYVDGTDDRYSFWVDQSQADSHLYTLWATGEADGITRQAGVTVYYGQIFAEMVRNRGPYHYWRLDDHEEGASVAEDAGRNRDGVYVNGPILGQPGVLEGDNGHSVALDGDDDYIDLGKITIGGRELSLMTWVRFEETDDDEVILSRASSSGTVYWELSTEASEGSRYLTFSLRSGGDLHTLVADSDAVSQGEWHLVVGVYDGSRMQLYLDGQLVAQRSKFGSLSQGSQTSLWVGARRSGNEVASPWCGWVDEVAVFSSVLDPIEIEALYDQRAPSLEVVKWHD